MSLMLTSVAYLFAAIAVGIMGFAIQRGATCTVAAMDEVVNKGRFHRLTSIVEASLWVVGGLLIAQALNLLGPMPAGYPVSYFTVLGAALLGIGAYVNRACVFGAVARLGSGEWAYLITPVGFYVGCLGAEHVFPGMSAKPGYDSPVLRASSWVALGFGGLMLWRLFALLFTGAPEAAGEPWRRRWRARIELRVWSPHVATTVIGITFFFALLLVGAWAYTDVLAELAMGMKSNPVARFLLLLALFIGAVIGGWTAGRFRSTPISGARLLKCFAGGALMGWGSLLIPGGNDGLILVGMPLLRPYAWVAFATMCIVIGLALRAEKALIGSAAKSGIG
jgi:hypothetical protein